MADRERYEGEPFTTYLERIVNNLRTSVEAERNDMYALRAELRELKGILTEREIMTKEWRQEIKRQIEDLHERIEKIKDGRGSGVTQLLGLGPVQVWGAVGVGAAWIIYTFVVGK